jgi:diketogulonate reductase-like aldo/keto reductase
MLTIMIVALQAFVAFGCDNMPGSICGSAASFDLDSSACAANSDVALAESTCTISMSTTTSGSLCWFPSGDDVQVCLKSSSSGLNDCKTGSSPNWQGWTKAANLDVIEVTNLHTSGLCTVDVSDMKYCCSPIQKVSKLEGPTKVETKSAVADDPDLCSVVQPYVGPCECQNVNGGIKVACDVDLLGIDTVGVALASQPCASAVTADIEVTEKDLGIDYKVAKLGAGADDNIPIPGLSIGIPGTSLNAGAVLVVQLDGGMTDISIKVGLNLCVDVIIGSLCGNDIPGLSGVLPVFPISFQHIDFSGVCPGPGANDIIHMPTTEIAPGVQMPLVKLGVKNSKESKANTIDIVSKWLQEGGRGVDAAFVSGDQAEIAEAIASSRIPRKEIFLSASIPPCVDVQSCIDTELAQLHTDYLDLLLVEPFIQASGLMHAGIWKVLEQNVEKGTLRSIGVSGFDQKQLQELSRFANVKPALNRIQYNVFAHDEETIKFCHERNITVEAYSPLEDNDPRNTKSVFTEPTVRRIATAHNTSQANVAFKWIMQRGDAISFHSTNVIPVKYADLWGFTLSIDEMADLDSIAASSALLVV